MIRLGYILKKEFLVMGRDVHTVAVLFVMPAVFILVMSLAMRDLFQIHAPVRIDILAVRQDDGPAGRMMVEALRGIETFRVQSLEGNDAEQEARRLIREGQAKFAVVMKAGNPDRGSAAKPLRVMVSPSVGYATQLLVSHLLEREYGRMIWKMLSATPAPGNAAPAPFMEARDISPVEVTYVYRDRQDARIPTAVQQSVPAWLVFSMFFIVIPIANTFIAERDQGTLLRLQSMNVSRASLLAGKMAPYLVVNLLQAVCMIAVGMTIVPLLGGTALTLGDSIAGLALIAGSVSFCAISLALFVASVSRTTGQATTIGGILNIILGVVGGVMVPKFVMPPLLQELARWSPLSWGLEGFLDIFLRGGGAGDVLEEAGLLWASGWLLLIATSMILKKKWQGSVMG